MDIQFTGNSVESSRRQEEEDLDEQKSIENQAQKCQQE